MMTVFEPDVAVLAAVRVNVLVPVVLAGLNDAVTPAGKPEATRFTRPLKPLIPDTVRVPLPLLPCGTLMVPGESAIEKSAGGGTVKVSVVVWTRLPEVPVMVIVEEPRGVQLATVSVRMLLVVAVAGLNVAVIPIGSPLATSFTAPLKPLRSLTAIVLVPLAPRSMDTVPGVADNE
jgi:hypothetical protein